MSITRAVRLSGELIDAAETIGKAEGRFAAGQIEFWANIGRQLAPHLSPTDLVAIQLGLVHIHVEAVPSPRVDPQDFFTEVESQQNKPFVSTAVTPASFQYESSQTPGYIDRVNADGTRVTGKMIDGQFVSK